jgi:erythromycin esterase-like protein
MSLSMKTTRRLALAAALLLSSGSVGAQPFAPESGVDAAKPAGYPVLPGIWKLHGQQPGLPTNDLEPLRRMIGPARVVALGESYHTSGGFYVTKHRLFRYMVEKMGFRVLAFETPWAGADETARYVQTCSGTPEEAIASHFWVWQSTELADLVEWMCQWNRSHRKPADKVHFFGFDIQQPEVDGPALLTFLQRIGIAGDHPWVEGIDACEGVTKKHEFGGIPWERHELCTRTLAEIDSHFEGNSGTIQRQTSSRDLAMARLALVGLWANEDQYFLMPDDWSAGYSVRDVAMAYAFLNLRALRYPGAKTVVWAANSHIARDVLPNGARPMGSHLAAALRRDYVNFAIAAYDTEIDLLPAGCGAVERPPGAVEERLDEVGPETLLVDFARSPFLPRGLYPMATEQVEPHRHYTGMIWMRHSAKMHPLRWRPCE